MEKIQQYLEENNIEYYPQHEIKSYLTIGIGGTVKYLMVVHTMRELKGLLAFAHAWQYRLILLGGGSNVVFSDGYTVLPVIVNRTSQMEKQADAGLVKVNSGVLNKDFTTWAIENGVGGLDFLAGIPGTIGGAAAVNAGSFGQSISMMLEKAEIFSPVTGEFKTVDRDYFKFQYRDSIFKYGDEVILDVFLSYRGEEKADIREKVKAKLRYRKEKHPAQDVYTAGCFFKNPIIEDKKLSAGKLIEGAGFKGTVHGVHHGLEVADAHANF
ncbi:MAG: UDP-N-acetylmuramate dehydrogenase, partial [bacterium]|nr:UDP-N-acetylmuramate dehydrogenase [bacterium]